MDTRVGQWQRYEAALENSTVYADPYRDVTLDAAFERPDGSVLQTWGFYDGGRTWRARCMPDQIGTWRYTLAFSDSVPGARGWFDCVPSDVPGMLSADESNPMWFGFKGGAHVLIRSLHVGDRFFAANWPETKRTAFLDWAQAQGYNLLSVASHYLNRPEPGRCLAREGERYLVYLPEGGAVDLAVEGGPYPATWIHGRDTADRRAAVATGDGRRWVAPGNGDDWLLYLEPERSIGQ